MNQSERLARIDEVNRFEDFCTDNDPRTYLDYSYKRTRSLDALAGPIKPGEQLEVSIGGHTYLCRVEGSN